MNHNKNQINIINKKYDKLEDNIKNLDSLISKKPYDHRIIEKRLINIKKERLLLGIIIHKLQIYQHKYHLPAMKDLKNKLKFIDDNIELIDNYNTQLTSKDQQDSIDKLTLLNTIFLPLTLITGYYGMNFRSMGSPSLSKGIFAIKNSNTFVLLLFVISIILTIIFYRFQRNF